MIVSILISYLIGTPLAFILTRWLLRVLSERLAVEESSRRWIRRVGGVLGILVLAPSIFAGVIVAGYVEQNHAGAVTRFLGMEISVVPVTFGLLLVVGIVLTVAAAATCGAGLGSIMARALFVKPGV